MVDRPFVERNAAERARLDALLARLSDEDLARDIGAGWTIAAALAHLAFWEQRALVLLRRWQEEPVCPSAGDVDVINDALLPQWRALPPRSVTRHLLQVTEAVDSMLAAAADDLLAAIESTEGTIDLFRSEHRSEHLDQVERVLSPTGR